MEVVVSIVSWNTVDLLRTCLASLIQHMDPARSRIVVIDNGSRDGSPEMVRREFPQVSLMESGGNLGFGKAHNMVVKATTEPYILFFNPDTESVEDVPAKMADLMNARPEVALLACRTIDLKGTTLPLGFQWPSTPWSEFVGNVVAPLLPESLVRRLLPTHDPEQDGYVRKLYGGCLMARRAVLDEVGWFDERFFMYGEDVDMSRRVENAGYRLFYLASARIIHVCGGASAKAPGRFATTMQCESISKLMAKYYGPWGSRWFVVVVFVRSVLLLAAVGLARLGRRLIGLAPQTRLENSWLKHLAMFKWSTGTVKATIPQ